MNSAFCTKVGSNLVFIQYLQNRCVLSVDLPMDQIILTRAAITDFPGAKYLRHWCELKSKSTERFLFWFLLGFFFVFFFFFGGWGGSSIAKGGGWSAPLWPVPGTFTRLRSCIVCVFVRHLFSFYPFYFDFHSARIIFDVFSGFYLWNINKTTAWHL